MIKLAVIGKDVSKSTSPEIHNFIASELGLKISYEKISVPEEQFESRIDGLIKTYDGFNVTIPYKLSVIPHLKSTEGDATAFGAVNTVLTSTLTGYNTDGLGFMQMLNSEGVKVKGCEVLLLGAGGAGRSVAKKLSDAGAYVDIYDRNFTNAESVAAQFASVSALKEVAPKKRKLIVNATGVGMHKTEGLSPVGEKSEFLRIAEDLGKKIINGRAMLFYQAYYSDCIYFGLNPSPEIAAKLFKKYLKEVVK